jgi:membrane associated rhomboid family serine protease
MAREELGRYAVERQLEVAPALECAAPKPRIVPLFVAAWFMLGFWALQNRFEPRCMELGGAASDRILAGEIWRVLTSLTLHADVVHMGANLASGLLFGGFLLSRLGVGCAGLAVISAGAIGNALNAVAHGAHPQISIGASTAVFGALGVLCAIESVNSLRSSSQRNLWRLILPVGAGWGLLAFLGTGEGRGSTDLMAHLLGFIAGAVIGTGLEILRIPARIGKIGQWTAGILAGFMLIGAWGCAYAGG